MSLRPDTHGNFPKVVFPFYGDVSLGNATMYKIGAFRTLEGRLFVGIEGRGAYTFSGWCHWTYASEKLGLRFESDARAIADFINSQLGHPLEANGRSCQGSYDEHYTSEDLPTIM